MRKCLAIRWGAWGDMLYCLPALERLKKDYGYLHLETGSRGAELFRYDPRFDRVTQFEVGRYHPQDHGEIAKVRWGALEESTKWDKVVNFWQCLEVACIAEEWQEGFFFSRERRREYYGRKNFIDVHLEKAGYEPGTDSCGSIYLPEETVVWMEDWKKKNAGAFVVAIVLSGSTAQKTPFWMRELAERITEAHPDTKFYLLGDREAEHLQFSLGRKNIVQAAGKWGIWQAIAMTFLADYVIGPETFLMVAAGVFGTPKSMIATSCGYRQATAYHKNDFSIQSTFPCSPCHRAIYNYQLKSSQRYCNEVDTYLGPIPGCNLHWNDERVLEGVEFAYKVRGLRKEIDRRETRGGLGSLPELLPLLVQEADRGEEIRHGVLREVQQIRTDNTGTGDISYEMGPGTKIRPLYKFADSGLGMWKWGVR